MGIFSKKPRESKADAGDERTGTGGIGVEEIQRFLDWGERLAVSSSYCAAAQYDAGAEALTIFYDDGTAWRYDPVSRARAEQFLTAPSKGGWCWDNLRVRGSRRDHQVNATQV